MSHHAPPSPAGRLRESLNSARPRRGWGPLIPALILLLGIGLSILAFHKARLVDEERVESTLALQVEWRVRDFREKLKDASVPVEALALFLGSQTRIEDDEFHRFASQAGRDDPISRLAWAPLVTAETRAAFDADMRQHGVSEDHVTARSDQTARPGPPEEYLLVHQEERFEELPSLLGYDFLAEPIRRATAQWARDTGKPNATPPIGPLTVRQRPPSFSLLWPVYRNGIVPSTRDERRAALLGFATGSYPIEALFGFALSDAPALVERLSLFIGDEPDVVHTTPLAYRMPEGQATELGSESLGEPARGTVRLTRSFQQFGQTWTLIFDYPPSAVIALRSSGGWAYLALGLFLALALSAYVAKEERQRADIERLVGERTQELRRTSDQLSAMIEASPHAIICVDNNRNVMLWNRSAEDVFGYDGEEVIGHRFPLLLQEDAEKIEQRSRRVDAGEIHRGIDARHRHKNGTVLQTSVSAASFRDSAGHVQGLILIIEDCTARNRVQQQLHQAQKMEAVGHLTGGMAHDFNNLLGIVLGNIDLLAELVAPDSEEHELVEAAMHAALRGAELTRQLLAFARRQPLAPKRVALTTVLNGTAHLLRRTLGEAIKLEVTTEADVWPVVIDTTQLESAILNLAVNGRDAMGEGGQLTIETSNVTLDQAAIEQNSEATAGDYVVIAVSDTGSGMSPEILAQVFEPFFTTKGAAGTGLGLSMVHGFVKQSGGFTKVYSEPGRGTTVRIYLPRAAAGEAARSQTATGTEAAMGTEIILVVEDNKGMRDIAVRQLQNLGYRTIPASDGAQALEILRGGAPVDLLFTDVVMPNGIDGRALAHFARQVQPTLRILFTSGFTRHAAAACVRDDLRDHLLSKPYRKEELARHIRSALDGGNLWNPA